jgi:hypothetical protein
MTANTVLVAQGSGSDEQCRLDPISQPNQFITGMMALIQRFDLSFEAQ